MANFFKRAANVVRNAAGRVVALVSTKKATPPPAAKPAPKATTPTRQPGAAKPKSAKITSLTGKRTRAVGARQALTKQPVLKGRRTGPHNKKSLKNLSAKQRDAVQKKRNRDKDDKRTRRKDASKAAVAQRKNTAGTVTTAKQSVSSRVAAKVAGVVRSIGKGLRGRRGS